MHQTRDRLRPRLATQCFKTFLPNDRNVQADAPITLFSGLAAVMTPQSQSHLQRLAF